jgi:sporulation protein YlmC with PRC-barrel domain
MGEVVDVFFDDRSGKIRHLVVGFLTSEGDRYVLLAPEWVKEVDTERQIIAVTLSRREVEHSPDVEADPPVSLQRWSRCEYVSYRFPWCEGIGMQFPMLPIICVSDGDGQSRDDRQGDPHLRSMVVVATYAIKALDGWGGWIRDFLMDIETWTIRNVLVKTRRWLPGRKVLVPWRSSKQVNYSKMEVQVNMTRDHIRKCPKYDPRAPGNVEYGVRICS